MGTQLEISIGIYTDGVYVDKLFSEDLYLDAWQSDTVLHVCSHSRRTMRSLLSLSGIYPDLDKRLLAEEFAIVRDVLMLLMHHGGIQFGMKYHVNAHNHKLLTERGLVPKLHFFTPLVCRMYLVVKDYIHNRPDTKSFSRPKQTNCRTTKTLFLGGLRLHNVVSRRQDDIG
ncbi:hypothetical protein QCA50_014485 [Cerrena zonata]|uniref:Uncharacterized protein n=1 Tax=Cerrena zonata TaxID=2478898 RepID=A0AAW0FQA2_9APHY